MTAGYERRGERKKRVSRPRAPHFHCLFLDGTLLLVMPRGVWDFVFHLSSSSLGTREGANPSAHAHPCTLPMCEPTNLKPRAELSFPGLRGLFRYDGFLWLKKGNRS